mmetsp:Transcript_18830/g.45341  ORF Transcript_18830/g.45341 Transcript_18830/m.45341 type:complete len:406 (+) Transcript_18830:43-1260(+)
MYTRSRSYARHRVSQRKAHTALQIRVQQTDAPTLIPTRPHKVTEQPHIHTEPSHPSPSECLVECHAQIFQLDPHLSHHPPGVVHTRRKPHDAGTHPSHLRFGRVDLRANARDELLGHLYVGGKGVRQLVARQHHKTMPGHELGEIGQIESVLEVDCRVAGEGGVGEQASGEGMPTVGAAEGALPPPLEGRVLEVGRQEDAPIAPPTLADELGGESREAREDVRFALHHGGVERVIRRPVFVVHRHLVTAQQTPESLKITDAELARPRVAVCGQTNCAIGELTAECCELRHCLRHLLEGRPAVHVLDQGVRIYRQRQRICQKSDLAREMDGRRPSLPPEAGALHQMKRLHHVAEERQSVLESVGYLASLADDVQQPVHPRGFDGLVKSLDHGGEGHQSTGGGVRRA